MRSPASKFATESAIKRTCAARRQRGLTLVELVTVLVLIGILAAAASMALRDPVQAYVDVQRRADLTEAVDTALRRIGRDVRLALPNSVRTTAASGSTYMELLLTKTGGRYRAQQNSGSGDVLDLAAADTVFDTLGPLSGDPQTVAANDIVVVFNLFASSTIPTANAYSRNSNCASSTSADCNTAVVQSIGAGVQPNESRITFTSGRRFPQGSPGNRFHVISPNPVTYICTPDPSATPGPTATGSLRRVTGYAIALAEPTPASGSGELLIDNVLTCNITYTPAVTQSLGLVTMQVAVRRSGETVSLYHEVHVSNIP